jgi:hypothetical protein
MYQAIEDCEPNQGQRIGDGTGDSILAAWGCESQLLGSSFPDEDRLSKRKSIGETISLQVEVESRNSPEKEEVSVCHCPGVASCCPLLQVQAPLTTQHIEGYMEISFLRKSIFLLFLIISRYHWNSTWKDFNAPTPKRMSRIILERLAGLHFTQWDAVLHVGSQKA